MDQSNNYVNFIAADSTEKAEEAKGLNKCHVTHV